jgi:hypothetical protein
MNNLIRLGCFECRCFHSVRGHGADDIDGTGECRRHSPQSHGDDHDARWPVVCGEDWCEEYRPSIAGIVRSAYDLTADAVRRLARHAQHRTAGRARHYEQREEISHAR